VECGVGNDIICPTSLLLPRSRRRRRRGGRAVRAAWLQARKERKGGRGARSNLAARFRNLHGGR